MRRRVLPPGIGLLIPKASRMRWSLLELGAEARAAAESLLLLLTSVTLLLGPLLACRCRLPLLAERRTRRGRVKARAAVRWLISSASAVPPLH